MVTYNISTLTANLDGMLDALFFYPNPLNKIILENRLHKFKNYILSIPNESRYYVMICTLVAIFNTMLKQ